MQSKRFNGEANYFLQAFAKQAAVFDMNVNRLGHLFLWIYSATLLQYTESRCQTKKKNRRVIPLLAMQGVYLLSGHYFFTANPAADRQLEQLWAAIP